MRHRSRFAREIHKHMSSWSDGSVSRRRSRSHPNPSSREPVRGRPQQKRPSAQVLHPWRERETVGAMWLGPHEPRGGPSNDAPRQAALKGEAGQRRASAHAARWQRDSASCIGLHLTPCQMSSAPAPTAPLLQCVLCGNPTVLVARYVERGPECAAAGPIQDAPIRLEHDARRLRASTPPEVPRARESTVTPRTNL